jgi:hypothetical protein
MTPVRNVPVLLLDSQSGWQCACFQMTCIATIRAIASSLVDLYSTYNYFLLFLSSFDLSLSFISSFLLRNIIYKYYNANHPIPIPSLIRSDLFLVLETQNTSFPTAVRVNRRRSQSPPHKLSKRYSVKIKHRTVWRTKPILAIYITVPYGRKV